MADKKSEYHTHEFGDHEVTEYYDTPIPHFLKWVYVILPIWGMIWFFFFNDGSYGWLDRGAWRQLEQAANTTRAVTMNYDGGTKQPQIASEE